MKCKVHYLQFTDHRLSPPVAYISSSCIRIYIYPQHVWLKKQQHLDRSKGQVGNRKICILIASRNTQKQYNFLPNKTAAHLSIRTNSTGAFAISFNSLMSKSKRVSLHAIITVYYLQEQQYIILIMEILWKAHALILYFLPKKYKRNVAIHSYMHICHLLLMKNRKY